MINNFDASFYNCEFDGNTASKGGAISICIATNTIHIDNCSFKSNKATLDGGAIHVDLENQSVDQSKTIEINNCVFSECKGRRGGALYLNSPISANLTGINRFDSCVSTTTQQDDGSIIFLDQLTHFFYLPPKTIIENQTDGDHHLVFAYCHHLKCSSLDLTNNITQKCFHFLGDGIFELDEIDFEDVPEAVLGN